MQMYELIMCALLGLLAEEETDSEDDGGHPLGDRSQRRGAAGHGNGSSQEIQPFSANQITDRQSGCPVDHSHKISEEINLSFKNNGEFLLPS